MSRKISRPSGTCEMPSPTILSEPRRLIDRPRNTTSPFVGGTIPQITFSVVLFPAPLAPRSATMLCSGTRRLTSDSASIRPYVADTLASWIMSATARLLRAEIRLDDAGMVLHLQRSPFRNLLPEAQHGDPVRDRHDELHHVLDQEDSDASGLVEVGKKLVQLLYFARAETGRRLVEKQKARRDCKRSRNLEELLVPEVETAGLGVPVVREARVLKDFLGQRERRLRLHRQPLTYACVASRIRAEHDVLQHRELVEQLKVLKRAGHAPSCHHMRLQAGNVLPVEYDPTLRRLVDPRDAVEDRRLARAVWADERVNGPSLHIHREPIHGREAAEADCDVLDRNKGIVHLVALSAGQSARTHH